MTLGNKIFFMALIAVIIQLGFISPISADRENKLTIRLHERASIKGDYIKLGEIATVEATEAHIREELSGLVVGKSPLPGKERIMERGYVLLRLKQTEMESSEFDLHGPEKIVILREVTEITPEEIREKVRNFLRTELPWKNSEMEIDVSGFRETIPLPKGKLEYSLALPKQTNYAGMIPVMVILKIDNREMRKIWVNAHVRVFQRVAVARRALRPNEIIQENDLTFMEKDIDQLNGNLYLDDSDLVGKKVRSLILPEQIITSNMVEIPLMIRKGDLLTIIAKNQTMSVRIIALGKAEQNGREGDLIKVTNTTSKKEIQARILDSRTVLVEF